MAQSSTPEQSDRNDLSSGNQGILTTFSAPPLPLPCSLGVQPRFGMEYKNSSRRSRSLQLKTLERCCMLSSLPLQLALEESMIGKKTIPIRIILTPKVNWEA